MDWSLRRPWGFLDAVALSRGERYILANRGTRCIDPAMDSSVYLAHSFGGRYGFVQPETERDRSDVGNLRMRADCVFTIARVLVVGSGVVRGGICGDITDGGDEHDGAEPGAGRIARASDGGVRDDVHGRAAARSAAGWRNRQKNWSTADAGDFRFTMPGGKPGVRGLGGDAVARGERSGAGSGWIGTIEPARCHDLRRRRGEGNFGDDGVHF